jgi:hypothetical protein
MTPAPEGIQPPLVCLLLAPAGPEHHGREVGRRGSDELADRHLLLAARRHSDAASGAVGAAGPAAFDDAQLARLAALPGVRAAQRFGLADVPGFAGTDDRGVRELAVVELHGDPRPFRERAAALLAADASAAAAAAAGVRAAPLPAMFLSPLSRVVSG